VPAGTALAEKQELVRNNGSEPASLDPHKVESDVEFNFSAIYSKGWCCLPGWVNPAPAGGKMGKQRQHRLDLPFTPGHYLV
jgi:hypothetical protein